MVQLRKPFGVSMDAFTFLLTHQVGQLANALPRLSLLKRTPLVGKLSTLRFIDFSHCMSLEVGKIATPYFTIRGGSLKNIAKKIMPKVPISKDA